MSVTFVYFIMMLDNIRILLGFFTGVSVLLIISIIGCSIHCLIYYNDTKKWYDGTPMNGAERRFARIMVDKFKIYKKIKYPPLVLLFFCIILTFVPTTKEAVTIYLVPKIAHSKAMKTIPPLIEKYLEKELHEAVHDKIKC